VDNSTTFYSSDAIPVAQPTMSLHLFYILKIIGMMVKCCLLVWEDRY